MTDTLYVEGCFQARSFNAERKTLTTDRGVALGSWKQSFRTPDRPVHVPLLGWVWWDAITRGVHNNVIELLNWEHVRKADAKATMTKAKKSQPFASAKWATSAP